VALVEDQLRVEVFVKRTEVGSADKLTVGTGVIGLLPPPPPPQETINKILKVIDSIFFIQFNLINPFLYCHSYIKITKKLSYQK
jgi:hypothetical protein